VKKQLAICQKYPLTASEAATVPAPLVEGSVAEPTTAAKMMSPRDAQMARP